MSRADIMPKYQQRRDRPSTRHGDVADSAAVLMNLIARLCAEMPYANWRQPATILLCLCRFYY